MVLKDIVLCLFCMLVISAKYTDAANAYLYYENASCLSGGDVMGELYYVWDDKNMKGKGRYIKKYKGSCKYFENGVFNPEFQTGGMKDGYCIICKGMLGCTSKQYSCSYFETIYPSRQTYKMSYNSTTSGNSEDDDHDISDIEEVAENIYQEILSSNNYKSTSSNIYFVAGAAVASTIIFAVVAAARKYYRRKLLDRSIDPSSLTEKGGIQV